MYAKSPGWQPTLCVAWCLICWFALAYKKYGHTWHRMSLLRPGVIKKHKPNHLVQISWIYVNKELCQIPVNSDVHFVDFRAPRQKKWPQHAVWWPAQDLWNQIWWVVIVQFITDKNNFNTEVIMEKCKCLKIKRSSVQCLLVVNQSCVEVSCKFVMLCCLCPPNSGGYLLEWKKKYVH